MLKFDVFGKSMLVQRKEGAWLLFIDSRSRVFDVVIPTELTEQDLAGYLDDIFHEHSSEKHPHVIALK